jgi:N-glycosylase/DNA lyase
MTPVLVAIDAPDFDLALTLDCGQLFHWQPRGAGWLGLADRTPLYVEARANTLLVPPGTEEIARHFFALNHPLAEIYRTFPQDEAMAAALNFCHGLRLVRQPAWECLATFITSAMKQVAHIRQMSFELRRRYGEPVEFRGETLFTYPTAERLAECTEAELRDCKLGFRAKNLLGAARLIASGEVNLESVAKLDDESARAQLCRLPGVGVKVANCALLFGFERLRAFPIDVWIERILREIYFRKKRKVTAERLRIFSSDYFGAYGGYAQQYLFHHARKTWKLTR